MLTNYFVRAETEEECDMIVAERKQRAFMDKFDIFGEEMPDGRLTASSDGKIYRMREAHYSKVCYQGKRNDIIQELQIMNGEKPTETCGHNGHNGHKFKSRDALAEKYGYSSRNMARYLRINSLIRFFKDLIDDNKIALLSAVDMSYLSEKEPGQMRWEEAEAENG